MRELQQQHAETANIIVERATANLPQATQAALFTVTGRILLTQIVGEVTTAIQLQTTNLKLISNPTVGADVDICSLLNISGDAVGTLYNITGTLADALIGTTSVAFKAQADPIVIAAGTIDLDTDDDSSTGQTKWTIHYIPLDSNSIVVTA